MASNTTTCINDDDELHLKLTTIFRHKQFKSDLQKTVVKTVLNRSQDVFISMPPGSGKSLCFQLPAVIQESKVAVVFSPNLPLIKDQLKHLKKLNVAVDTINFKMTDEEKVGVINKFCPWDIDTKILYVTPEQASDATFTVLMKGLYKRNKLSYIVVDEAHCVSKLSHDFNHDYQNLGKLRSHLTGIPWIAVTAVANKAVEYDIMQELGFRTSFAVFKAPCFRPNIYYDVAYKDVIDNPEAHLVLFLSSQLDLKSSTNRGSAIIYCRHEKSATYLVDILKQYGILAVAYHSGLEDRERETILKDWMAGKYTVVVTTLNFSVGINITSVRCIVHWCMPRSLAAYYHETGSAGRDGSLAWCRLYYSLEETDIFECPADIESVAFRKMVHYCVEARETSDCKEHSKENLENNNNEHTQKQTLAKIPEKTAAESSGSSSEQEDRLRIDLDAEVITLSSEEEDSDVELLKEIVPSRNTGLMRQMRKETTNLTLANCFRNCAKKRILASPVDVICLSDESDSELEITGFQNVQQIKQIEKNKKTLKKKEIHPVQQKKKPEKSKSPVSSQVKSQVNYIVIRSLMKYYNCGKITDAKLLQNAARVLVHKFLKSIKTQITMKSENL